MSPENYLDLSRLTDEEWLILASLTATQLKATLTQLAKAQANGDA